MPRSATRKAMGVLRGLALFGGAVVGLALVVGLTAGVASVAFGANGQPLKLGINNAATALTRLTGNVNGSAMQIRNTNPDANDSALSLRVQDGEAPMRVNSGAKVADLNADRLDGKGASGLLRVASFAGNSPLEGTEGTVAKTRITAPAKGFLVIDASSDFSHFSDFDGNARCSIRVDDTYAPGSGRFISYEPDYNTNEDCSTNSVVPVAAGAHTVVLDVFADRGVFYGETVVSAIYVPYGATGSPPSSGAVSAAREAEEPAAPRAREEGR